MITTIQINKTHITQFIKDFDISFKCAIKHAEDKLKNNKRNFPTVLKNKFTINVIYPHIINELTELQLFPKELKQIINDYCVDELVLKYRINAGIDFDKDKADVIIKYKIIGDICYDRINFIYASNIHLDSSGTNTTLHSERNSFNFLHVKSDENQYNLIDVNDNLSFINYYMKYKFNKSNFLSCDNKYDNEYTDKNNVFYSMQYKQHRFHRSGTIICESYTIERNVINDTHLVVCAQIIKKMTSKLLLITQSIGTLFDD